MCDGCSHAHLYHFKTDDYVCVKKGKRGLFEVCEEYTKSRWEYLKSYLISFKYVQIRKKG